PSFVHYSTRGFFSTGVSSVSPSSSSSSSSSSLSDPTYFDLKFADTVQCELPVRRRHISSEKKYCRVTHNYIPSIREFGGQDVNPTKFIGICIVSINRVGTRSIDNEYLISDIDCVVKIVNTKWKRSADDTPVSCIKIEH
ncbi:hypothetical protein PFISCL1PPCAC_12109, partial [Pristionchus fissidentatus]